MKDFADNIVKDKITLRGFLISFLLTFVTIVYILINYKNLPPFVPVFNQLPWGNDRLIPTPGIFVPVVIFSFIFIFNIIFSSIVYSKNPLIARIVAAVTLITSIIIFISAVRTVLVII